MLQENNRKYLETCLKQHRNFTTFLDSVGDLLGFEVEATVKRIASRLAINWKDLYSRNCGYVKSRVETTLVRAMHC